MKTCSSEEMDRVKNSQIDISTGCKNTLAKLKEKTWKQRLAKIAHNWRTRRQLINLDEAQLKDIGLTAADVDHEVNKSIWK